MSNKVWTTTSNFENNYRYMDLSFPGRVDYPELARLQELKAQDKLTDDEEKKRKEKVNSLIEIEKIYFSGRKLDPEIIPNILYAHNIAKNVKLPAFFRVNSGIIISESCAEILKKFRLGETGLYPLSFFDIQLNESVNDQTYYFLNIAELRSYLRPEDCIKKMRKQTYTQHQGYQLFNLYDGFYADNAIAIAKEAVECDVDLWRDPELKSSIFISDALKDALDAEQLSQDWQFFLCKLV
ncbi:MAG: hypothetical protein BGN93_05260 [Acinetobacter sp. 39-4]|nr:MAG: hypothetical protein BGN93_05260 [Acinetobacter sp. 39-4]OJU98698.1 MAG: hypothetical protein BGO19_10580 [Acinetobacter sp. 38-8]